MFDKEYLEETLETAFGDPESYYVPMGITRYDYAKMHGWYVRIHRDEVQFQEMFYDSKYQSFSEGLRAAILFRHEVLSGIPLEKKVRRGSNRAISTDPNERVHRRVEKGKLQPYISWLCTWYDENYKVRTKRFSVNKFGEEGAKKLALEHTKKHHNTKPKPMIETASIDPYLKQKFKKIARGDVEVLATVNSGKYEAMQKEIEGSDPFGFEGEKGIHIHTSIERDPKLRAAKINSFLEQHGKIFCEVCSLRFTEVYPFLESDIIEVHHIIPLSKLTEKTKTTLNDLILLCANCHLAVHQGDAEENLLSAIEHFSAVANEKH